MNAVSESRTPPHRYGLPRLRQGRAKGGKGNPRSFERSGFSSWRTRLEGTTTAKPGFHDRAVVHTRAGCDGQRRGVTAVVLRWVGLRVGVLHLQFLLPETGLLRGQMPGGKARRQQRRAANRRHQHSREGRLDHRDHQRAYRERLRRVTDHTSPGMSRSVNIVEPVRETGRSTPLAEGFHDRPRFERLQDAIRPVCILCGPRRARGSEENRPSEAAMREKS